MFRRVKRLHRREDGLAGQWRRKEVQISMTGMVSGKGSIKAKQGGPHPSEVVQLSWHKGPVAGVLGLMAAGGEAEREEKDRPCEASAMLTFLFLEGKGCGKMASGKLTGRFKKGLTGRDLQGSPDPCFCSL